MNTGIDRVAMPYLGEILVHDVVLEAAQADQDYKLRRQQAHRVAKRIGGSWPCQGKCGRTISANADFCLACSKELRYMEYICLLKCGHEVIEDMPNAERCAPGILPCPYCETLSAVVSVRPLPEVVTAAPRFARFLPLGQALDHARADTVTANGELVSVGEQFIDQENNGWTARKEFTT